MQVLSRGARRFALIAGLALAAGCAAEAPNSTSAREGFTLEVFAHEGEQIYLVRHADGRKAAARVENGVSALMDASRAQTFLGERAGELREPEKADVSIRAPGFSLQVADEDDVGKGERARIEINAGGKQVLIDAEGDGEGEADRAIVRIAGADEETARNFINEADGLSSDTRSRMLQALRL